MVEQSLVTGSCLTSYQIQILRLKNPNVAETLSLLSLVAMYHFFVTEMCYIKLSIIQESQ